MTYDDVYTMLTDQAGDICYDPRAKLAETERDGVWSAFTEIWFFFDLDYNGFIEAHDIRDSFATMDFWTNGKIDRDVVESVTDGFLLELCFETAIVDEVFYQEQESDSACYMNETNWISRKRRCNDDNFWNSRGNLLQRNHNNGLFDILD